MQTFLKNLRRSLVSKLILLVGLILIFSLSVWAYFNINYQKKRAMDHIVSGSDQLTHTIKLGTQYAMMHNLRDDISRIITNIAAEKKIENIRIYNKEGEIKYSSKGEEVDRMTNIKDEACFVCHRSDPPLARLRLAERTRFFTSPEGYRLLGIISPIYSEPGCASNSCHFHPADKTVLGALDVVISLEETDREIMYLETWMVV